MKKAKIQSYFGVFAFCIFALFGLVGCASYQSKVYQTREFIQQGRIDEALNKLEELSKEDSRDQLLYVLDYATALQIAGRYKESATQFIKADKLVDINDYHSVTNIVGATLGGEEMVQYKGESYEKFLINTMNAINYLMMENYDDALVEARRINEKISKMKMDGRDPYELSPFANYLSAILWEAQKKYDDAYIEYEASYKLDGTNPFLPKNLIESAKRARRTEAYNKWKSEFSKITEDKNDFDKKNGELVILYQEGWGAQKTTRPGQYRFPSLKRSLNGTQGVQVTIADKDYGRALPIYDVDRVAIDTLEKDFGALVARRVGGIAAKAVVADQIRQKDELLGGLAWIAMNLADRADLRQWSTLPASFQMLRNYLKPGLYKVKLQGIDASGNPTGESFEKEIKIKSGEKTFINWRSLR